MGFSMKEALVVSSLALVFLIGFALLVLTQEPSPNNLRVCGDICGSAGVASVTYTTCTCRVAFWESVPNETVAR